MGISIPARLESELRAKAEAQGITVEAYLERLLRADEQASEELSKLAREGLNSGEPIEPGSDYWNQKHSRLELQLKTR
jgi:hypothetical protein